SSLSDSSAFKMRSSSSTVRKRLQFLPNSNRSPLTTAAACSSSPLGLLSTFSIRSGSYLVGSHQLDLIRKVRCRGNIYLAEACQFPTRINHWPSGIFTFSNEIDQNLCHSCLDRIHIIIVIGTVTISS